LDEFRVNGNALRHLMDIVFSDGEVVSAFLRGEPQVVADFLCAHPSPASVRPGFSLEKANFERDRQSLLVAGLGRRRQVDFWRCTRQHHKAVMEDGVAPA
jgi:hypothetical protein